MIRMVRMLLGLTILGLAGLPASGGMAAIQRSVMATVVCREGTAGPGVVEVDVFNYTESFLQVSYVRALAPRGPAFPPGIGEWLLANGEQIAVNAPRLASEIPAGEGALVVTSAGVLVIPCDPAAPGQPVTKSLTLGPTPTSDEERRREGARIAAESLGQLESLYAFDALYALLHPDAQAAVSFEALGCWYLDEYAPVTTPGAVTVTGLTFGPWQWSAGNSFYPEAAEIAFRQRFETGSGGPGGPQVEERAGVEHLSFANGQWRWFFGGSQTWLNSLRTDCGVRRG